MLRVNPIMGAVLPKSIFGRAGIKPILLFEEHKALKNVKSAFTMKIKKNPKHQKKQPTNQQQNPTITNKKPPPQMFTLCHFKSDLLDMEDKKKGRFSVPQHY